MSRTGDKFQRLRIFVTLVKEGSFAGAAARLQLKSPTISKALQLLEEELNTQLIVRSTRSMHLTEPGERYFQKASYLINELDELDNETRQFSGTPRGRLRVTAPVALGEHVLGPLLPKFLQQYPDIQLELDVSNDIKDMKKEGFDVAIRAKKSGTDLGLFCIPIRSLTPTLVASPTYLAQFGTPTHPDHLSKHQFVLHRGGKKLFNRWRFQRHEEPELFFEATSRYVSNHISLAIEAALQGMGIINTYLFYVEDALTDGRLVRLLPDFQQPDINRYAFYHQRRQLSPKLDVFLRFLEQEIGLER
ncbi:LysR family transcriptional regulator [Reinekea sp. G2M2-21]|uniref:LysR family transcriptional regulator n=1 Tax=Reinekea sp. G2M2-21 TaxID=2788942 RepID=UPI0018A89283|nr:LysR family transcriptional regulator [Reinekea sp. G2M2-21]